MRRLLTISLLTLFSGCRPAPVAQSDAKSAVSEAAPLTGRWHASNAGLTVDITLDQVGDSVKGTGSYSIAANSSIGCGGETLSASGPVMLSGKLTGNAFDGRMSFAGTWTPPYLGTIRADSLNGHFMSIDRGGCPLVLLRQR